MEVVVVVVVDEEEEEEEEEEEDDVRWRLWLGCSFVSETGSSLGNSHDTSDFEAPQFHSRPEINFAASHPSNLLLFKYCLLSPDVSVEHKTKSYAMALSLLVDVDGFFRFRMRFLKQRRASKTSCVVSTWNSNDSSLFLTDATLRVEMLQHAPTPTTTNTLIF